MKEVVLTFPDNIIMAEFILVNKVGRIVVNSTLHTSNIRKESSSRLTVWPLV